MRGSSVNRVWSTWRLPGKLDVSTRRVHPPHEQLGVELPLLGIAERPFRTPLTEAENDRLEVAAGLGEQILGLDTLDKPGPLELTKALREQVRERPGNPRAKSLNRVVPTNKSRRISNDQRSPSTSTAREIGQYWP